MPTVLWPHTVAVFYNETRSLECDVLIWSGPVGNLWKILCAYRCFFAPPIVQEHLLFTISYKRPREKPSWFTPMAVRKLMQASGLILQTINRQDIKRRYGWHGLLCIQCDFLMWRCTPYQGHWHSIQHTVITEAQPLAKCDMLVHWSHSKLTVSLVPHIITCSTVDSDKHIIMCLDNLKALSTLKGPCNTFSTWSVNAADR